MNADNSSALQSIRAVKNLASFGAGMLIFLALLYFAIRSPDDTSGASILFILMILQLTPAIIAFTRGRFNYIAFIFANHFIAYSVAKYNLVFNVERAEGLSPEALAAAYEMIYCSVLILFAYTLARALIGRAQTVESKFEVFTLTDQQFFFAALYAASVPLHHFFVPPNISAVNQTLVGAVTTLMFCSKCSTTSLVRWMKMAVFCSTFITFINTGSLSHFASIAMILFMTSLAEWKVAQLILLLLVTLVGTAVNSIKGEFRMIVRYSEQTWSFNDRSKLLGSLVIAKYAPDIADNFLTDEAKEGINFINAATETDASDDLARSFTRIGDDSLERVLEYTPSRVPYWGGSSYSQIPYMFIPRILWPGKPAREFWNQFGRLYEFISDEDDETSVGVNFLAEGYMNFGYLGLYSTAIIFGILVAAIESLSFVFFGRATYFGFLVFLIPFSNYGFDTGTILNSIFLVLCVTLATRFRLLSLLRRDAYA